MNCRYLDLSSWNICLARSRRDRTRLARLEATVLNYRTPNVLAIVPVTGWIERRQETGTNATQRRRKRRRAKSLCGAPNPRATVPISLLGSGSDRVLITLTGSDHESFMYILQISKPPYNKLSPYGRSCANENISCVRVRRRTCMSECDCFGLSLSWYRTRGSHNVQTMLFGITQSACAIHRRFSGRIFLKSNGVCDNALIGMPAADVMSLFKETGNCTIKLVHN